MTASALTTVVLVEWYARYADRNRGYKLFALLRSSLRAAVKTQTKPGYHHLLSLRAVRLSSKLSDRACLRHFISAMSPQYFSLYVDYLPKLEINATNCNYTGIGHCGFKSCKSKTGGITVSISNIAWLSFHFSPVMNILDLLCRLVEIES